MELKDLIKIENHILTKEEANEIIFLHQMQRSISLQNFEVVEKIITHLPAAIDQMYLSALIRFVLPNVEPVERFFY